MLISKRSAFILSALSDLRIVRPVQKGSRGFKLLWLHLMKTQSLSEISAVCAFVVHLHLLTFRKGVSSLLR